MTRVLVTGSSGFVGTHLTKFLQNKADLDVVELDLPTCDVTVRDDVLKVVRLTTPDLVFHLAGIADSSRAEKEPLQAWTTNTVGTLNLLDVLSVEAPSCRTVVTSSAAVYGGTQDPEQLNEERRINPLSTYAYSKVATEYSARTFHQSRGLDTVVVRPFNMIGPGQLESYVLPRLVRRLADARETNLEMFSLTNPHAVRDFIDVRDAVQALYNIALLGRTAEAYNICSGVGTSIHDLAALICKSLDFFPDFDYELSTSLSSGNCIVGDPTKLVSLTGWEPAIPLNQSIGDQIKFDYHNRTDS